MFAVESEKKTNTPNVSSRDQSDLTDKILFAYKKLKSIAKSEFNVKNKFKPAQLSQDKFNKLKSVEANIDCLLVAYEYDTNLLDKKFNILNRINSLLTQYSSLFVESEIKKTNDDFSKFFE